jgi:hypothetical protein
MFMAVISILSLLLLASLAENLKYSFILVRNGFKVYSVPLNFSSAIGLVLLVG